MNRALKLIHFIVIAAAVTSVGCGDGRPKRVKVSGQVLIDGEPVKAGSIRFVPEGARPSSGDLDEEGNFSLTCFEKDDGAVLGSHRVQVAARAIEGDDVRWYAPKKYSDINTSELSVEITEPTDSLVIELTWDGKKPRR